jgi:protein O-GlcNAc transferase
VTTARDEARRALAEAAVGRYEAAIAAIDRALALEPHAAFWLARGEFLVDAGRAAEAGASFEAADRLRPGHAPTLNNLAFARLAAGDARGAEEGAVAALAADPAHAQARANLGRALHLQGAFTRAEAELARAAAASPADASLHLLLANTRLNLGRAPEAIAAFDAALAAAPPDGDQVASARLVALHYVEGIGAEAMLAEHRAWATRFASPRATPAPLRPRAQGARIRVGYVSPRLHQSTAGALLAPVFAHHDRDAFEIYAYACSGLEDDLTARLKSQASAWRHAGGLDDEALVRLMRQDGIDVAVDLCGHTPGHRLGAFARRPAPVTVTWLDYFDTTGLDTMGAIFTDTLHSPPQDAQRFTERVVRLPTMRYCWEPPAESPEPRPMAREGPFTFGSFNRIAKLSEATLAAWCEVLRAVPDSRLVVKSPALGHPEEAGALRARFSARGIDPARVEPRPGSPHARMLDEYGDLHVVLDSFPYNGGMTTLEALWMERPVLALAGDSMISRQSAAILGTAGMEAWVARGLKDYVSKAVAAASDRDALAAEAAGLRARLAASPAMDAPAFTRSLENAYRRLWDEAVERARR